MVVLEGSEIFFLNIEEVSGGKEATKWAEKRQLRRKQIKKKKKKRKGRCVPHISCLNQGD
jgi:hypothetical protein